MHPFTDRIAVLGFPDSMQRYHAYVTAPWTPASLARLRDLGFTQVQMNLAWGSRPDDETLNLEDVVAPPSECSPQPVPLNCQPGPEAFARRRALLHERIAMARAASLRTLFHFGAPYNRHQHYGDTPPNCILDPELHRRYVSLLESWYHRIRHLPLTGRMRPAVAMVALADGERTWLQGLDPVTKIAPPADGYSPRR